MLGIFREIVDNEPGNGNSKRGANMKLEGKVALVSARVEVFGTAPGMLATQ